MLLETVCRDQDARRLKLPEGTRQKVLGDGCETVVVRSTIEAAAGEDQSAAVHHNDRERGAEALDDEDNTPTQ